MITNYYKIPLNFDNLIDPDIDLSSSKRAVYLQLEKTKSLKKSIDEHIELILTTHPGEYKPDDNYGFIIWKREFENMELEKFNVYNNPKQEIEASIYHTLKKFEPRLNNIKVDVLFISKQSFRGKNVKFYVDVNISGIMNTLAEDVYHNKFQFTMGPFFK